MDVNGIVQNANNTNSYSSNSTVSDYTKTDTEVAIPQVQQVEPKSSAENETKNKEYSKKDLDNAVKKINNFLRDENTHAEYSFNKDFPNTLMIKIINDDTKQVILEVPPKKILDMIASMCKECGLFDRKA
jgi:flagellar protein FlaG